MLIHSLLLFQAMLAPTDSAAIAAVRAQAEREPVEAIGGRPGHVSIREIRLLDVNGDGYPEAFVSIEPKFRQTPTILVYSFDAKGPHRLLEALVPGNLVPISGRFEDPHSYRVAIDMHMQRSGTGSTAKMVEAAISSQLSLVEYKDFMHSDMRQGFISYVDLSDRRVPNPQELSCQDFEFELVESLATGTLDGDPVAKYVAAMTEGAISIYRITGIRKNGMLDKRVVILTRPADSEGLATDSAGVIRVRMRDGTTATLALP